MGRAEEEGMKGFFVRDNGVGFEPGAAAGIFTPFSRLRPEYEGTGIGLATVQRIVARHQGIVRAEGVPDKGATFYVCFPVSQPGTGGSP
jgi:signal transduction histidine kinase